MTFLQFTQISILQKNMVNNLSCFTLLFTSQINSTFNLSDVTGDSTYINTIKRSCNSKKYVEMSEIHWQIILTTAVSSLSCCNQLQAPLAETFISSDFAEAQIPRILHTGSKCFKFNLLNIEVSIYNSSVLKISWINIEQSKIWAGAKSRKGMNTVSWGLMLIPYQCEPSQLRS